MANSSIIEIAKNKIIRELINDDSIVKAINSTTINSSEDLIGTHIFDYHQNPNTLNTVQTFITIQVHIPEQYRFQSEIYVKPVVEFWIISHEKHMKVDNIPKIKSNRNDYISRLLDIKFNGKDMFGIGVSKLLSNVEGSYQQNYLYRKLTFECVDLNKTLCEEI